MLRNLLLISLLFFVNGLLSQNSLAAQLSDFPVRGKKEIQLRGPEGELLWVALQEDIIMPPGLQEQFPDVRTFSGIVAEKDAQLFVTLTEKGTRGLLRFSDGRRWSWRSSPTETQWQQSTYNKHVDFNCTEKHRTPKHRRTTLRSARPEGMLRVYRLALSLTGEYTQYHGGTKEEALAAAVLAINALNHITERDFGVRFEFIEENAALIFTDPDTDPFSTGNYDYQNEDLLEEVLDEDEYDIGHVITAGDEAGVGAVGSVCVPVDKGSAYTSVETPEGDVLVVDYLAHEIGHQLGAYHTFNGELLFCGDQRDEETAFEPGSGTTIMSYAGICGLDNIQPSSDPYFHLASIQEVSAYVWEEEGSSCGTVIDTKNRAPDVQIPAGGRYLPVRTPFELAGTATDAEGDSLLYSWEQFDLGPGSRLGVATAAGPLFRSQPPQTSGERSFPNLTALLNGQNPPWEVLPENSRLLNFMLSTRDGQGNVGSAAIRLEALEEAGPFQLGALPDSLVAGTEVDVRWEVANTDQHPINAKTVDVYFSTNGGQQFDYLLAEDIPNSGQAFVLIPDSLETTQGRFKIKPKGQLFFAINDKDLLVQPGIVLSVFSKNISRPLFLFPNPAEDFISWTTEIPQPLTIRLYSSQGKLIQQYEGIKEIDISSLETGGYFLQGVDPSGRIFSGFFIKK